MEVYLDCAATTPVDPRVQEQLVHYLTTEFGNAGSRTHEYGLRARRAVEKARDQVAAVAGAGRGDVIFTSGATESNNLAILGLAEHGLATGKTHIVSTQIEHHAVLEPLEALSKRGFDVTLVPPTAGGWVDPDAIRAAIQDRTLLVSVMHVNNETGVVQPIAEMARLLEDFAVYFHVDAAQGFGKEIAPLRIPRIDLVSISGHKICAPKGIGALIARRRTEGRLPLAPLMFGGGQERGLRPGTAPVHLIAALGEAAELACREWPERRQNAGLFRARLLSALEPLGAVLNGDQQRTLPNIVNLSIPEMESEAVMEAWAGVAAISNGAACTSQSYTCSHVLSAMGLPAERMNEAVRLSWCHLTPLPDLEEMVRRLAGLGARASGPQTASSHG